MWNVVWLKTIDMIINQSCVQDKEVPRPIIEAFLRSIFILVQNCLILCHARSEVKILLGASSHN